MFASLHQGNSFERPAPRPKWDTEDLLLYRIHGTILTTRKSRAKLRWPHDHSEKIAETKRSFSTKFLWNNRRKILNRTPWSEL